MIFKFDLIYKTTPWGGSRIMQMRGLPESSAPIGESWEISAVKGMESTVCGPMDKGMTLPGLIDKYGERLLGSRVVAKYGMTFPLLIKILDAQQWLSLQVHPDDAEAHELETSGMDGKSEMWHIIDALPGARLICGFKPEVDRDKYVEAEGTERLLDLVQYHDVRPGDNFYVGAGTIHAIGPGCLIAEVQQSSDYTYRVYDYGRPRELHLDKARRVLKFSDAHPLHQPLEQFKVNGHHAATPAAINPAEGSFQIVMILDGHCTIDGIDAPAGTTLLLSADHGVATLTPKDGQNVRYLTVAV